ncbi:MAG: acylphosphatase [Balneolaceae bacterium]|nr:acylphosphatase [Balneolaceae bacterium]
MKRVHVHISGRVQGVGFRHFTRVNAKELDLGGWVMNLPDGRVEAVFQGGEQAVDTIVERCRRGPRSARVSTVEVEEEAPDPEMASFDVRYA